MRDGYPFTGNIANDSATVGFQAQVIHNATCYQNAPEDSPEERYRDGVRYLDGGILDQARQLIGEAIVRGHITSESVFHWVLALVSGRSLRQLSEADFERLRAAHGILPQPANDEWAAGLRVIAGLLDPDKTASADHQTLFKEFDTLGEIQRDKILRHLKLAIGGSVKEQMWQRSFTRARIEQLNHERRDRVWRFFQPHPAPPRILSPVPVRTTIADWGLAITATTVLAAAAGYLLGLLIGHGRAILALAHLVACGCACLSGWYGLEWRFRVERIRAKDRRYASPGNRLLGRRTTRNPLRLVAGAPAPNGFTQAVDKLFDYHLTTHTPQGADYRTWRADTAGIRQTLRDEIVEVYRETRVDAPAIAWLIRHRVSEIQRHWLAGTLLAYREQLRTPLLTKLAVVAGITCLVPSAALACGGALWVEPSPGLAATVLVTASGWLAARRWVRILLERRRFEADEVEAAGRRADDDAAYQRQLKRLARQPTDPELATWLDCDRKCLMDMAIRCYKLAATDVIAYAFLEAPAPSCLRARVRNGPWRYSGYQMHVFLLTANGVRQLAVRLNFTDGSFHDWRRHNYRFEAIASAKVKGDDNGRQTFVLSLVNRESITLPIAEPRSAEPTIELDSLAPGDATIDASGIRYTLRILEGIAADGKEWVRREHQGQESRTSRLASAINGLSEAN